MEVDHRSHLTARFICLPTVSLGGHEVPVATTGRSRLLGLAFLDRRFAGVGLLIPRCRSVHTFGMRFRLEVIFLDELGQPVRREVNVGPRRLLGERRASAVLELPWDPRAEAKGGEGGPVRDSEGKWFPNETR